MSAKNKRLLKAVLDAIEELYADTSVDLQQAIKNMETVVEHAEDNIDAAKSDIDAGRG